MGSSPWSTAPARGLLFHGLFRGSNFLEGISAYSGMGFSMGFSVHMWWVHLSWAPAGQQAFLSWTGRGEGKMKNNNHGSRERQFNKMNTEIVHGSKGKKMFYSLLPISYQQLMSCHFLGSRASVLIVIALEDKHHK